MGSCEACVDFNMWMWFLLGSVLVIVRATEASVEERVCIGTNGRMSVPSNREHHYRNLRDRYTNCTYVDGNLELTWLQDETLDLSFLQYIREVTGYVLISHVDVSKIVLPRLQIIRGRTLLKLNIAPKEYALMVALSKMQTLELPGLRDILAGSVGFYNNYNLCHIKTINWEEILTGVNATQTYVFNFTSERECPPCHKSCEKGCWGEGPDNCQKFSKINCSPQCFQGRCFGSEPRQCCHLFCAGGCTGPKQTDCLACRSVYDDGVCTQECPPMQVYNPTSYSWETNPNGKYAYGATCVKNCPDHLLKDSGACVKSCPSNKRAVNGECIPCEGPCPKTCKGVTLLHDNNVAGFKDCTVIEGSITILEMTFKGFQDIDENFTIGPLVPPMSPQKLEVFSTLQEITGFLNIQGYHENFTSLSYFRNLEIIGGREVTAPYFASLYIVKTSLKYLGLTSLKKIHSGGVSILENKHLCYLGGIDWKKIKKSTEHHTLLQNNKKFDKCQQDAEVCDAECRDGCWGPGPHQCVACAHFQYGDECISNCDAVAGLYRSNVTHCMPCHAECESMCSGPGAEHCRMCKNVRDGTVCVPFCPITKYNTSGECQPCHPNCVKGCLGPSNSIGPDGCVSCDKAIINGNKVERCLQANETCPDGYYAEWLGPYESGPLKPLSGKEVCRRCHPRCKKCSGYGFSQPVCLECVHYKHGDSCEEECSTGYYADNATHECVQCNSECIDCYGPASTDCYDCRNMKVYLSDSSPNSNNTGFNCTANCPPEFPYRAILEDNSKPYCSVEPAGVSMASAPNPAVSAAVIVAACGMLLLTLLLMLVTIKRQQRKEKENEVVKMSMILSNADDEYQGDVQPNMSKLRICTENHIRKGVELGSGAFGRVYQGMLFPEDGYKSKPTPVAIKVLKEGTNPEKNKQTLEEAYIMASVHHQYLLKLIGVCMTSEMMLITPLMPLGCILDYLQRNRTNIGSKMMLTWCQQIAEGMAYLEGRKLIHRDLAARNVLLGPHLNVKITDFGLARLLDIDEEEYKADGSKVPVKWLALECIKDKIFSHKSDVWAYGVTIWELLTYGKKPYSNIRHTDVAEFLEKGDRLPHPQIATIEVYKTMLSCWYLSPESRPGFRELVDVFKKMVPYSQRYLLMSKERLLEVDEKKNISHSLAVGCDDMLVDSEDYLQPSCSNIGIPVNDFPFSENPLNWDQDILQFTSAYPSHFQCMKDNSTPDDTSDGSSNKREVQFGNKKLDLPVDDDDYLMPSPQRSQSVTTTATSVAYMDLISDSKPSDENQNTRINASDNFNMNLVPSRPYVCNLEYDMVSNNQKLGIPHPVHQLQRRSSEEESDHEYYNDFDKLQRELQPLRRNRNETPV